MSSLLRNTASDRMSKIVERSRESRNSSTFGSTPSPEKIILDCICSRVKGNVLCTICGWMGPGRVRFVCPAHPRTFYLMDFDQCPKCHAYPPLIKEIILMWALLVVFTRKNPPVVNDNTFED